MIKETNDQETRQLQTMQPLDIKCRKKTEIINIAPSHFKHKLDQSQTMN